MSYDSPPTEGLYNSPHPDTAFFAHKAAGNEGSSHSFERPADSPWAVKPKGSGNNGKKMWMVAVGVLVIVGIVVGVVVGVVVAKNKSNDAAALAGGVTGVTGTNSSDPSSFIKVCFI